MVLNHLDLFAGIGGFSLALRNAYPGKIKTSYSEIDKYAIKIYQKHFPDAINYGDIKLIRERELPGFNLITFGFPCQDISIAGKRVGLRGSKRSSLFFEAIRIIDANRPDYFIFENVKGFFSSHEGDDFLFALRAITDIGYDCQWQLLNTKWFLPQNRERIYLIGHLRENTRPQIFPIEESIAIGFKREAEIRKAKSDTAGCINTKNNSPHYQFDSSTTLIQVGNIDTKGHNSIWGRVYDPEGIATTLNSEGGGLGAKTGLYVIPRGKNPGSFNEKNSPTLTGSRIEQNIKVVGYTRDKKGKRTDHLKDEFGSIKPSSGLNSNQSDFILISDSGLSRKTEEKEIVPPLRSNTGVGSNNKIIYRKTGKEREVFGTLQATEKGAGDHSQQDLILDENYAIRRLTPTECERLQGFPDGWTEGISDTQRYKTLGNAISVPIVEEIFRRLYK